MLSTPLLALRLGHIELRGFVTDLCVFEKIGWIFEQMEDGEDKGLGIHIVANPVSVKIVDVPK